MSDPYFSEQTLQSRFSMIALYRWQFSIAPIWKNVILELLLVIRSIQKQTD
ncbi:MAG: hypothetical protein RIS99_145 [Bacteroidota bacterium]